ncbi:MULTISPECIES: hypothetical protein [unclassified Methylobacterium]|uniref:hypothetical protein n=1 Tax=unclassified Methylobacterium TaxID=2615210 RepID=UPI000152DDBD|nr:MULTISPECIES: hypothetical protein [Methylobacterium]WFT77736.1 hypothetical protein QA634_20770 [Methylobacterium nodulans]
MSTAQVAEARTWLDRMVQWESRGPGDTDNALRRVARLAGVNYGSVWSLRYRAPKRIWADVYVSLAAAYETARHRQLQALQHDIEITAAITGPRHPVVVAARSAAGAADPDPAGVVAEALGAREAAGPRRPAGAMSRD